MSNDSNGRSDPRRRPPHRALRERRPPRSARLIIAVAAAGLLGAACGGGSAASGSPPPNSYQAFLAYVQCLRTHGAPNWPDPVQCPFGIWGFMNTPSSPLPSGPSAQAAQTACRKLQPREQLTAAQQQELLSQALRFSDCMRAHGLLDFPDPSTAGGGVSISVNQAIVNSPQYHPAQQACQKLTGFGKAAS
jgi:hypothetical protein